MKVFISYARIDKPYCVQLVSNLDVHDVWYDQRLYAGQAWWQEILRRLDWCECFIFLLSPESVNSEYCIKELDIALRLNRAVIPVLIHPDTEIPQSIASVHYVDTTNGLNVDNVRGLLNSIYLAEQQLVRNVELPSVHTIKAENKDVPLVKSAKIVGMAASALENAQYDRAVYLLKQAKENGYHSRFINLDVLLAEAERVLEEQTLKREAEREYEQIYQLFQVRETYHIAIDAFERFREVFPDYDPENIAGRIKQKPPSKPEPAGGATHRWEVLPLLKWLHIPEGVVRIDLPAYDRQLVEVDEFWIAKYPITNQQYQEFINDPDGYYHDRWWLFSDAACKWFENNRSNGLLPSHFKGKNNPRETVNWYEAIAFCNWLGSRIGCVVTLPSVAQWRRAAVGDEDTLYPWGNEFSPELCNSKETNLRMTTPVTRYPEANSPFGVSDMAGNVWEWTFDKSIELAADDEDHKRAVIGGSHVSSKERAKTSCSYFLKPESRYATIGFRPIIVTADANLVMKINN